MTTISWTQTTSGSWATASAWSSHAPLRDDDVTINPGDSVTVTYGTGALVIDSLSTGTGDTLDMIGGTLTTLNGFSLNGGLAIANGLLVLGGTGAGNSIGGSLTMSGGTLQLNNSSSASSGMITQTGGTILINHGIFADQDGGTLAGTVSGNGEWLVEGQVATVLSSGFELATSSIEIASTLSLQEKLVYGNLFTLTQNGTLNLNGNAVGLSGASALDGDVRGGSLRLSGTGHFNGLTLDSGALATITGTYNQTGTITLGSSLGTGTLVVASGGLLRITGNDQIAQNGGLLTNDGIIEKTAGSAQGGVTLITSQIDNTGTIDAAIGTIEFAAPAGGLASMIGGTLTGAGTVAFSTGVYVFNGENMSGLARTLFNDSVSVTLASALAYGGNWDQTGGLILVQNALTLNGLASLDGGELKGTATVTDNGPLLHIGNGMDLEGNLNFVLGGAAGQMVDQTGVINLGLLSDSVDNVTIGANTAWALEGASSIIGSYGTIINNGIFEKSSGNSQNTSVVNSTFNNSSTGSLIVGSGTLTLTGQGSLAGHVSGSAILDLTGAFTFGTGLSLTVGELIVDQASQNGDVQVSLQGDLTYANQFAMEGGTLALNGHTLALNGVSSFVSGTILGSGVVQVADATSLGSLVLAQGADLQLESNAMQLANILMIGGSSAPTLVLGTGIDYTLGNDTTIGGANNSVVGTVAVDGTLTAFGNATIASTVLDSGTINIAHGDVMFLGPLTGSGALTISAGAVLELDNTTVTSTGITFGAGGAELYVQSPADFAGIIGGFAAGDEIELNGFAYIGATLTVSGNSATIMETNGSSMTLNFASAQTSLALGVGSHGGLTLVHM